MASQHPYRANGLANRDLIKGWRFGATMQLRTPLHVLRHHGEVVLDVDAELPEYGPSWAGMWIPVLRTWEELGVKGPKLPEGSMASEIGQIPRDGGQFLVFLKEYRTVVESDAPAPDRREGVRRLLAEPRFADITSKLGAHVKEDWGMTELSE